MKVNLKKFVEVLEKVLPALGAGGLVPEYKCFHIDGKEIWATDGTLVINSSFDLDTELECSVYGAPFLHLLRSLDVEEVDLIHKDGELKVVTDKVKGVFTTLSSTDVKKNVASEKDIVISEDYTDLIKGLSLCRYSVSKDETLGPLCGVMIEGGTLLSSDRYRIALYKLKEKYPVKCSLPLKFVSVMIKNKDGIDSMSYIPDDRFTIVLTDGTRISTLILVGEHPDLLKYFPSGLTSRKEVTLVDSMSDVLERHISFLGSVDPVDKEILVKIGNNECMFVSVDKELGTLAEEVEVQTSLEEDQEIEFSINPIFLREVSRLCPGFNYYVEEKIVLFEVDGLRYLVQTRE